MGAELGAASGAGSPSSTETARSRALVALMLALTISTGIVDAIGFLGLDRVFTGNMTGNVVMLGMGLAGASDLPVVGPVVALGSYLLGAGTGGRLLRHHPRGWSLGVTVALGLVGSTLALAAGLAVWFDPGSHALIAPTLTAGLGAAMGLQAAAARRVGVADVTTVVVTSTLTGLAADGHWAGRQSQPWARRVLAVLAITAGALLGALLLRLGLGTALGTAATLTLAVAAVGHVKHRRSPAGRAPSSAP